MVMWRSNLFGPNTRITAAMYSNENTIEDSRFASDCVCIATSNTMQNCNFSIFYRINSAEVVTADNCSWFTLPQLNTRVITAHYKWYFVCTHHQDMGSIIDNIIATVSTHNCRLNSFELRNIIHPNNQMPFPAYSEWCSGIVEFGDNRFVVARHAHRPRMVWRRNESIHTVGISQLFFRLHHGRCIRSSGIPRYVVARIPK